MNKAQKIISIFLVASIVLIAILYGILLYKQAHQAEYVFYYGITCTYCKIVEEFMAQNKIAEKIKITEKEVSKNALNAVELESVYKKCGLDTSNIGVPLLYYNGVCYSGDKEIISFLNDTLTKLNLENK